ncbi:hypothetical protein PIB30_062853, partial [Stylosanthes scabra]|nr:hypothetical protein [Stylosanthes scabra]
MTIPTPGPSTKDEEVVLGHEVGHQGRRTSGTGTVTNVTPRHSRRHRFTPRNISDPIPLLCDSLCAIAISAGRRQTHVLPRQSSGRGGWRCSSVNTEPNKPNPVQAWVVAVNLIAESSMEQAGGRTCKTLRRSSQTGHECTCIVDGGEVHVLGFRSSAWEHVSHAVAKERTCHIPFVEGTSGRASGWVGLALPNKLVQSAPKPAN